jgi:hypothetical protein
MKTHRTVTGIVIGLAVGLLTGTLSVTRAHADEGMVRKTSPTSAERMTSETFVVSGIDRGKRSVTLTNAEGERNTMTVPSEVKAFDTLKVGARVDVDYRESIAVSLAPSGTKPSMVEKTIGTPMSAGGPAGAAREMQISAEVVSVDVPNNKVTFKGPKGNHKTIAVADPALQKKLPNLKPGQVVQFTYTEAIAAGIRPAPEK